MDPDAHVLLIPSATSEPKNRRFSHADGKGYFYTDKGALFGVDVRYSLPDPLSPQERSHVGTPSDDAEDFDWGSPAHRASVEQRRRADKRFVEDALSGYSRGFTLPARGDRITMTYDQLAGLIRHVQQTSK